MRQRFKFYGFRLASISLVYGVALFCAPSSYATPRVIASCAQALISNLRTSRPAQNYPKLRASLSFRVMQNWIMDLDHKNTEDSLQTISRVLDRLETVTRTPDNAPAFDETLELIKKELSVILLNTSEMVNIGGPYSEIFDQRLRQANRLGTIGSSPPKQTGWPLGMGERDPIEIDISTDSDNPYLDENNQSSPDPSDIMAYQGTDD